MPTTNGVKTYTCKSCKATKTEAIPKVSNIKLSKTAYTYNGKVQRPGVCNALETLLVHRDIATDFLPRALAVLASHGVEVRADEATRGFDSSLAPATDADYDAEFLGALPLELAIREMADAGKPTVVGAPDSRAAEIYRAIARRVAVKVAERAKDMTHKFPNIVVQST